MGAAWLPLLRLWQQRPGQRLMLSRRVSVSKTATATVVTCTMCCRRKRTGKAARATRAGWHRRYIVLLLPLPALLPLLSWRRLVPLQRLLRLRSR
jgi:hypothetical protein